jgi:hypothetical protein
MPTILRGNKRTSNLGQSSNYRNQAYQLVNGILSGRSQFNNFMNSRVRNYLLLNNNGATVLGFALMAPPKNGKNRLDLLGAKKGYGKVVMQAIYENAKKRRVPGINVLNAVDNAQNFYKRQKYAPAPSTSTHGRIFHRAVSRRSPSVHTISSRGINSVPQPRKKRTRSPNRAGSESPTSKRRPSPKSPPSSPKSKK